MNLSYIKILPLLVFVAMLAFSVRFAEVAMDISKADRFGRCRRCASRRA
jgi:hypothetical protein